MSHPPSLRDIHLPPSSMSELDSLSDSDWLDIASGRDSDDNDSLSDQDSDRDEISSMPRSRRSSISNEDSMNSDVEAWEGFVSDGGEEPEADIGMYSVPLPSPLGAEPIAVGFVPGRLEATETAIAEEEQRVREALDQSFVGTLNSSRSSTGVAHTSSTHASMRDLRLSFPDPLTSSRDELNRSYEDVPSPTETTISSSTDGDVNPPESTRPAIAPLLEDPGLLCTTPAVQHQHHEVQHESERKDALEIVLYGSSSEVKWKFLQELIQRAAIMSGHAIVNNLRENEQMQSLRLVKKADVIHPFFDVINIYDRTLLDATKAEMDGFTTEPECPSLAIVYLPAAKLPVLSWHNSYLPVLVPSITDLNDNVMMQGAEDDWDLLGVPTSKTLKLSSGKSSVLSIDDVMHVNPAHAYQLLRGIGRDTKKISTLKPLTEHVKSMNAVTLFALMSIIMGFAFNTTFRPSTPAPTPTVNAPTSSNSHLWSFFAPQPNRSILVPSTACTSKGHGSANPEDPQPSIKGMALSAFHPGGTSLSVTSPRSVSLIVASTSKSVLDSTTAPTAKCKQCSGDSGTLPERHRASTDMVLHSAKATSLSEIPTVKPSTPLADSHDDVGPSRSTILLAGAERTAGTPKSTVGSVASAAANLKINSVLDVTSKALAKAVGTELAELAVAADEIIETLRERRDSVIRRSKGKARAFGEQIQNLNEEMAKGNERAKKRAKDIRKRSEELASGLAREVRKEFKARSSRAKKRAKELKQGVTVVGAEAWKTYEKTQETWESALRARGEDDENISPQAKTGCQKKPNRWSLKTTKRQMRKANKNICV